MSIKKIKNVFFSIIFPSFCLACSKYLLTEEERNMLLCQSCISTITVATGFCCPRCGGRLPAQAGLPELQNICHPQEHFVLAAATSYSNDTVRSLIHTLKYKSIRDTLTPLNGIIQQYINNTIENCPSVLSSGSKEKLSASWRIENCAIVPIPLHRSKERKRGFNQAHLIAEELRKQLPNIDIEYNNLIKIKNTKSQIELKDYKKRAENVQDSFTLKRPEAIAGKNIILVDDVFTSGATMREAVRVVKQAGAKKMIAFVVAKV